MFKKLFILLLEKRYNPIQYNPIQSNINSILIRPMGYAIGDAIVHTAHIKQLKLIFPKAKIGVLVEKNNPVVFKASQLVDEYIRFNILDYFKNYRKWDLLIDFENNFTTKSLFADRILMPNKIIIFNKQHKKYYNLETIKSFDYYFPIPETTPLSHYLSVALKNEIKNIPDPISILHTQHQEKNIIKMQWKTNKVHILLCPQGSKREIPPRELANLLQGIYQEKPLLNIEFILSYAGKSTISYWDKLQCYLPNFIEKGILHLLPKMDLNHFFALVESADIVIAVDGGAVHTACAFRKPLLSFFANSTPNLQMWTPLVAPQVPHYRVVNNVAKYSNDTANFPLSGAINWLIEQIERQEKR